MLILIEWASKALLVSLNQTLSISQTSSLLLTCPAPLLLHTTQLVAFLAAKHNSSAACSINFTQAWWLPWLVSFEQKVLKAWLKCSSLNACVLLGLLWHEVQSPPFVFTLGFQKATACLGPLLRWESIQFSKLRTKGSLDLRNPFQRSLSRYPTDYFYKDSQKSIAKTS